MEYLRNPPSPDFLMPTANSQETDNPYLEKLMVSDKKSSDKVSLFKIKDLNRLNHYKADLWELYRKLAILDEVVDPTPELIRTKTFLCQDIHKHRGRLGGFIRRIQQELELEQATKTRTVASNDVDKIMHKYQQDCKYDPTVETRNQNENEKKANLRRKSLITNNRSMNQVTLHDKLNQKLAKSVEQVPKLVHPKGAVIDNFASTPVSPIMVAKSRVPTDARGRRRQQRS